MPFISFDEPKVSGFVDFDAPEPPAEPRGILRAAGDTAVQFGKGTGILGTLAGGLKGTVRAVGGAVDVVQGDNEGLGASVREQQAERKDPRLEAFMSEIAAWKKGQDDAGTKPDWIDTAKALGSAAWNNPAGAGLMIAEQLPNSAVSMGAGYGGMKAGGILGGVVAGPPGAAAGAVIGGIAGLFAANTTLETGNKAIEARQAGPLSDEQRMDVMGEGARKGAVITGIDALTLGATNVIGKATTRAVESATVKTLADAGINIADKAAVLAARQNPTIVTAVQAAQKTAMDATTTLGQRAMRTGGQAALETFGESAGEYLGEYAASGELDKMEALIEAFSSAGTSAAEIALTKTWGGKATEAAMWGDAPKADVKPAAPLLIGNTPDPIIVFPDGTAGRRADLDAYINGLPEDQQVAARAKLMGMGARPATPDDILKAPDVDSAIAAFTASLTGTDMGGILGQANPLIAPAREMQAQAAADEADLADLAQSETRDLNTLRAQLDQESRKQAELDALQATGTGQFGVRLDERAAVEQAATFEGQSKLASQLSAIRGQLSDASNTQRPARRVGVGATAATAGATSTQPERPLDGIGRIEDLPGGAANATGTGAPSGPSERLDSPSASEILQANGQRSAGGYSARDGAASSGASKTSQGDGLPTVTAAPAIQRQPDILPADISRNDGKPFQTENGAKLKQREAGGVEKSDIVAVANGFVVRPKPTQENPSVPQADQSIQSQAQRQEPAAAVAPVPEGGIAGQPATGQTLEAVAQGSAPGALTNEQVSGIKSGLSAADPEDRESWAIILERKLEKKGSLAWSDVPQDLSSAMDTVAFGALKAALAQNPKAAIEAIRYKAPTPLSGATPTGQANGVDPAASGVAVPTGAAESLDVALKPVDQRLVPLSKRTPTLMDKMTADAGGPVTFGDITRAEQEAAANETSLVPERETASGWASAPYEERERFLTEAGMKADSEEFKAAIDSSWAGLGQEQRKRLTPVINTPRKFSPPKPIDQRLVPVSQRLDPEHVGRDNVPLSEGGKPFKTNKAAKDAKKNQPMLRVVRVAGGFALAPKTDAQIAAQEKNAKRLAVPRFGNPGVPLAAHEFIAGRGGLRATEKSDMGIEGNPRVGNRFLFGSAGIDMDEATEALKEAGYLGENASHDDARNLINRSLRTPQYTSEGTEQMAEREMEDRRKAFEAEQEAIAAAQEAEDNEWDIHVAAFERAMLDMPEGLAQSDMDMEDALLAAGYTEQEIENERSQAERAEADQDVSETPPGNSPQGDRGREGAPGEDQAAGSQSEGLTAPTRADVLRQQDAAGNAAASDQRAQIDREAGAQTLTAQTAPEQRKDTTGDIFGGPTPEEAMAAKAREDEAKAKKKAAEDAANGQAGMFDQPAELEAPPATGNPDTLRAQADLQNALADLADIFGKNTRATMMPEQEQKMLPVLIKVFDAAFRLGYHKFKDAAKFALDAIRKALGNEAADAITLDHLQGAYISMAGGKAGVDTKRAVIDVEDKADIESHVAKADNGPEETSNVPSPNRSVEPNRPEPATGQAVVAPVSPGPTGVDQGTGQNGGRAQGQGGGRAGNARVPADGAIARGERSDQLFRGNDEPAGSEVVDARTDFGERSGDSGITGVPPESIPASEVGAVAQSGDEELRKRGQQLAAGKLPAKPGDLANIRQTLPYLLPGQQEDVHKAEQRFAKPDGYGMLFTNGTGTGKTFTGLGVIKRHAMQGKTNTLIIVPDDKIAEDWVTSGKALGLDITRLASTKDKGKGIVITTYANMGENDELASRKWDLIVPDEAHSLMQSADGAVTGYLQNLRAITHHPDGEFHRYVMQNRAALDLAAGLEKQIVANNKIANLDDTMDVMRDSLARENEQIERQLAPIRLKLQEARDAVRDEVAAMQGEKRTRLAFLSATPFAYEKTVDWANGYLFDYKDGYPYTETSLAYNQPNPRENFFMTRFGYSMRYNKLTEPDGTKVDRGLMQRQFNGELKRAGALSGRMLDVPADYDRRFVLVDSAIGNKIDEALAWLTEKTKGATRDSGYESLRSVIEGNFDYLSRRYLLEAIKAQEVVPIIKKHMAMGRKVVVFHDYKKGGAVNPFDLSQSPAPADAEMAGKVAAFNAANADFRASFPELVTGLNGLRSPIEVFDREFPGVMLVNGDEKKADLLRRYKSFQSDDTGPQVMLVQSAKNKGWSGHDTTGKHQRVLINLGQPTAPTLAIQQEGRIYRTGQVSDAIMRYLNTGTNWERWTFATTIASRASTAENLGMGELARALKDSFIASFEESDTYAPGHEGEGKGGKERDKAANNAITEYDRAKTYYWATQKKNSKTKAQEGADYFATPEPVGLKMVQWLDVRPGEDALEPSGGHGAIARWIPDVAKRTVIEPSLALRSRLAMVMNPAEDRIIAGTFEDLAVNNKYHGIAMNPPFGTAGRTAVDHLAKAATHLRGGGRIAALIPTGPAADKKFSKWFYEDDTKPVKPLGKIDYGMGPEDVYAGDTIKTTGSREGELREIRPEGNILRLRMDGRFELVSVPVDAVSGVARTGARTESYSPAADLFLIADIKLPQVTFERAGTAVATRIVVIEKRADKDAAVPNARNIDLSDITDINELFDRLENLDIAKRVIPEKAETAPTAAPAPSPRPGATPKPAKAERNIGDMVTLDGKQYPLEIYTTNAGKEKRGVWMNSRAEAQKFSQRAFTTSSNRGKWFVDEYWFPKAPPVADGPMFARSEQGIPDVSDPQTGISTALLELGKSDDLYQYPRSDASSLKDIAADKGGIEVGPVDRDTEDENLWIIANTTPRDGPTTKSWMMKTPGGQYATLTRKGDEVYINAAGLEEGGGGSAVYDLAANFALNNGLVFIGDPNGLSTSALRRRLENMLSSAVKYGTTDHLAPHPKQITGSKLAKVPPLKWTPGDTLGNIRSMVDVSVAATQASNPISTANVRYDIATQSFRDGEDNRLDDAGLSDLLRFEKRAPGAGTGGVSTVQRNALFQSLLQSDGARRSLLESVRGQQDDAGPGVGGLKRSFYARNNQAGRGVHIDDANAVVAAVREALPTAPTIHIIESVSRAPAELRKFIRAAGAENDVDAAYHNGEIYVFPANIPSIERMQFVLAHHEIRHHGLAAMLGPRKNAVMLKIHESNPKIRALATEQIRKGYAKSRILATEEALADMPVADLVQLNGFDRIVAAVREWLRGAAMRLRRVGLGNIADAIDAKEWTDKDVAALIARAEGVSRGGSARYASEGTVFGKDGGALVPATAAPASSVAVRNLNIIMRDAGWEVEYVDLDLTAEKPKAAIRVNRNDGRFLIAKVDAQGRASFETFQRESSLRMDPGQKGRRPLSPMVDDTFLGRQRFEGARSMLRGMTTYLADNALNPIALSDMRSAWAGVMAGPVKQETALPAPDSDSALARTGDQTESPEFRKWFGDSKVVDAEGKPLVVYHGTKADFSKFDHDAEPNVFESDRGLFFFTSDGDEASMYSMGEAQVSRASNDGANVMPVYVTARNPFVETYASDQPLSNYLDDNRYLLDYAREQYGHDGLVVHNTRADERLVVVSHPEQIKSAIGNNGDFDPKNADIRFARSAMTGQTIAQAWQAPDESRMDDMLYSMQDKHIDTKRVVTAVREAIGGIADNLDPYLQEELYHGRAAKSTKDFLEQSIRPLMVDMQARGVEMSDFEEYLHNRHAERRNEQVAKVNPAMPDGGSGIKTADARAYMAGLPPVKRTAYQALAKRVDQMNRETRALLVSSGLEKQSTIDAWDAAYGDEYVPLMREEMDNGAMGIGQGFSVRGSASKRAMGSNKPVANILANIALQREKTITRAEKRRIGEALYGMVLSAPNPDFWIAVDPALQQSPAQVTATAMQLVSMGMNPVDAQQIAAEPTQRYVDPRTGQVATRINPALRSADNVLAVRMDGEDKYVFFNAQDPRAMRMAKALKNLDADQLGTVMGGVAKMTRYFASINTAWNPVFGVVNLTRDVQAALLNLQSTVLKGKQAEVMKHVGSALRGIYIDLRDHRAGKQPTSTWANLFEEFQREGGATGYRDMYANAQERADAIADELKKIKQGKALAAGRGVIGWLSDYNESMENAVRVAAYKVAKQQGLTNQQAASLAKNLTTNFNRKGQVALQAGALFAFFNAAVQGSTRLAQTMFEPGKVGKLSGLGKKIMTGGLLLGSMQALLLAAAGFDDEEPPDFVRERSLVLPIGGDKYISIPMPLGFHVIPSLSRIPTEWAMGGFKDTPKRLGQLIGLFADAFNPIGSAGLSIQTLAPTIIDPLAALAENRDWTGKPIAKKDFNSMQPTAGHTRAKDTATPWGKAIAYGVNMVTGGTDYKPGLASPTPDQIDYLIGQATGGIGREVSKLSQVATSTVSGEELPLYKIPLLGRFVGTTAGQAAESGRFYANLKEIGEHDSEITGLKKDRRMAEYQEYVRDNPQARLVPIAERTYREVSKLNRAKRDALKAGASKERIKLIDQQITARMAAFNLRVRATEIRETATQE